jgi:glutathionyl-hydroquinone reductase
MDLHRGTFGCSNRCIKRHYYESHRAINPSGIVPAGPLLDFTAAHGRERLAAHQA